MQNILFVTSEVYPLVKTGGLADVSGSLPRALDSIVQDVRIVLPAYPQALEAAGECPVRSTFHLQGRQVTVLEGRLPKSSVPVWFLDCFGLFNRPGNPYVGDDGDPWPDNAERFAHFARAVVELAMNRASLSWQPTIVHCNDWPSGLVPALLAFEHARPATVFTIHNLAYQGIFPASAFAGLDLPRRLWAPDALEFHDQLSFIKGGLVFADRINTVSPTYAEEIQTVEFGCGLEGLLHHRRERLSGILNGIDDNQWNPAEDPYLTKTYSFRTLNRKSANREALQKEFDLPQEPDVFVLSLIGRLVTQKGIDLVLDLLPELIQLPVQLVLLGSGERRFEQSLIYWARRYPGQIAVTIGYDEALSHRIEAGSDIFLMPSRFEPCGLNQMYSQRYGTIPIVRSVGGLADTVVDATPPFIGDGTATGIVFEEASAGALIEAIKRAWLLFDDKEKWERLQRQGMQKDFSWRLSAEQYLRLYERAQSDSSSMVGGVLA
jgi:starch synthase